LAPGGDEGRGRLRKARWSCQTSVDTGIPEQACTESIGARSEPGELKHLRSDLQPSSLTMPFRARLKKTFSRNSTSGSEESSLSGSNPNVYGPGDKMPVPKYRRPVEKHHKEKLEAFSFATAWGRKSIGSLYSPMGSRMPSRKNSAEPQVGRRSRTFARQDPEEEMDPADVGNAGLSRQVSADKAHSRPLSPLAAQDYANRQAHPGEQPFTPDELTLALKRSHLTVPT